MCYHRFPHTLHINYPKTWTLVSGDSLSCVTGGSCTYKVTIEGHIVLFGVAKIDGQVLVAWSRYLHFYFYY